MTTLPPYHVSAYNTAKASENKIHDDATAKRFGFRGGLVGGVHVYAYMAHLPVQRWGRAWLERGTGEARFAKPVYEGDIAEITAAEDAAGLELPGGQRGRAVRHRPRRAARRGARRCRERLFPATPPAHDAVLPPMNSRCRSGNGWA